MARENRPGGTSSDPQAKKHGYEGFDQETETGFISTNIDDFEWSQPHSGSTGEPMKLHEISSEELFREPPAAVEAQSGRVNWVARDLDCGESITYNIKGVADRRALEALGATILVLCKRHDTPVFNIKLGLESAGVVNDNRLRSEGARSQLAAADSQTTAAAQAHPTSVPVSGVSAPTPAASAYLINLTTAELAALVPPNISASDLEVPGVPSLRCANCHWPGHAFLRPLIPSLSHGSVTGCPECNLRNHNLDDCPVLLQLPSTSAFGIPAPHVLDVVYSERCNMPQIYSDRHLFFDEVHAINEQHKIDAAELNKPRNWPWTNAFAKEVAKAKPGDPILQGKLQPWEFDPAKHTYHDLPVDPTLRNISINDILAMRRLGLLDTERPEPGAGRIREPDHGP
ncbi:uncharacterized protein C8A04DRAFT_32953 [Dichotomopilus funicola]|uniref:Uncharacterized protein n=1 Tax=Dichotomopilus funicola TaxID=1934379 RepID=A0AAN6ZJC7_9PEZI|nr:hypothetical protein C8A04DRAFT_32953 [Dichotomopilus funicola]